MNPCKALCLGCKKIYKTEKEKRRRKTRQGSRRRSRLPAVLPEEREAMNATTRSLSVQLSIKGLFSLSADSGDSLSCTLRSPGRLTIPAPRLHSKPV